MAMHMGPGPGRAKQGEIPCRVYHGPAFRLIFDLADPEHVEFVMAGGNGGGAGSEFAANQYRTWLNGEYLTISFRRDELDEHTIWQLEP
jgi:acyl-homoserine lactone acylase PvdQ